MKTQQRGWFADVCRDLACRRALAAFLVFLDLLISPTLCKPWIFLLNFRMVRRQKHAVQSIRTLCGHPGTSAICSLASFRRCSGSDAVCCRPNVCRRRAWRGVCARLCARPRLCVLRSSLASKPFLLLFRASPKTARSLSLCSLLCCLVCRSSITHTNTHAHIQCQRSPPK